MKQKASFADLVYRGLLKVPRGKITTYKNLARSIGKPRAYRAVGNALNKNPNAPKVPCHRVIASDGTLGGYAHGLKKKTALLQKEGVFVTNGKIDLERYAI